MDSVPQVASHAELPPTYRDDAHKTATIGDG